VPAVPGNASDDDHALARRIAVEVGTLLLDVRATFADSPVGALRNAGDRQAHERIAAILADARPGDAVLSEEGDDDPSRLRHDRVWIVDPLDGTREFGELRRTDWAVHIALVVDGAPAAGAVALPAQDLVFATDDPPVVPDRHDRPLCVVTSRQWIPTAAYAIAQHLGADLLSMGSAGAKAMAVVRGDADVYAHAHGMYEWDSAAPIAVAASAGLHVSRINGEPLRYNRADPWLPDILVCRPELADDCIAALGF
jgi:3'(2'), 5'-bisphosphate nucleotidase